MINKITLNTSIIINESIIYCYVLAWLILWLTIMAIIM